MEKRLVKMSGLKAGYGFFYMQTYRDSFHLTVSEDELIVQLKKDIFPNSEPPAEIRVTVEWDSTGEKLQ